MEFKFDAKQPYQQEAIASVVDLFEGQPADADALETSCSATLRRRQDGQAVVRHRCRGRRSRQQPAARRRGAPAEPAGSPGPERP